MGDNQEIIEFTCNEEMDSLQPGDHLAEVTLFIKSIEPVRRRGNVPIRVTFTKFIGTNTTGRTLKLLFWADKSTSFGGSVVQRAVNICRARVSAVHPNFVDQVAGLIAIELHIQRKTEVKILGPIQPEPQEVQYRRVNLINVLRVIIDNLAPAAAPVNAELTGFIKLPIISTRLNGASYGAGSITDGTYKLRVNVAGFRESEEFQVNTHVRLHGTLSKSAAGIPFIQLSKMDDFTVIDDEKFDRKVLRRGYKNPPPEGAGTDRV